MQGDAACESAVVFRERQPTGRRGVVAGQAGQFLIEALETKAEIQGVGILRNNSRAWAIWAGELAGMMIRLAITVLSS